MRESPSNPLFFKIEERAKQLGFKDITALCTESGASRGALTDLKYGRTKELSVKTISKLAPALKVNADFFTQISVNDQKEKPDLQTEVRLDAKTRRAIIQNMNAEELAELIAECAAELSRMRGRDS